MGSLPPNPHLPAFTHSTEGVLIPAQISSDADWGKSMGLGQGSGAILQPQGSGNAHPHGLLQGPLQSVLLSDLRFKDKEAAGPFARMHLEISALHGGRKGRSQLNAASFRGEDHSQGSPLPATCFITCPASSANLNPWEVPEQSLVTRTEAKAMD